jgi:translocation and assembly module TamB
LTQGYIDDAAIEPAHIDVQYENNAVQIHELTLKTGDAILAAQGSYALHGPVQMQIAARNFPARLLTAITGQKNIQIDAPVDFVANLSGTGDHPSADVSLQLGSGTVNGISFTRYVCPAESAGPHDQGQSGICRKGSL